MNKLVNINFFNDFESAKQASIKERKPILLQFEREKCSGCKKLDRLTYPNQEVTEELTKWFIPLKLQILEDHKIRSHFSAVWTPSFYLTDRNMKIYYKADGYFNAEDFRLHMRIALSQYLLSRGKYQDVIDLMNNGLQLFPDTPTTSRLLFIRGQAEYLFNRNNKVFRATMIELSERFPNSPETRMWPWMDD
jgi:thioredoxin-related protein